MILHVDMDAFYAAVATRDHPELHQVPVIVGGGLRGVVLSANYLARQYGVRSGQPMSRARRLCAEATIIAPDFAELGEVSASVMALLRQFTPQVEVLSMDEAFLDLRGAVRRLGSVEHIAQVLRAQVYDEQRIACSVGVAPTATIAKIASRRAKPDGVLIVAAEQVITFLHPLGIGELYGVGEKTQAVLARLGLYTVADLAYTPRDTLIRALGVATGRQLHELSWGIDRRTITPRASMDAPEKSMGAEHTFNRDIDDPRVIAQEMLKLSGKVAHRLRRAELVGRTVSLKIRFADFTTITRAKTLRDPTQVTREIYHTAVGLYETLALQRARIRLVGVRVEGLVSQTRAGRQLQLGEREFSWLDADRAIDQAVLRFGATAVTPASLLRGEGATSHK